MYTAPKTGRVLRKPKHEWYVSAPPYCIQPVMLAPVIPGETLRNFVMQARVVTDPIKNPLMGWWKEYYFFYVRIGDLPNGDALKDMFIASDWDASTYATAAATRTFHGGDGINWTRMCLEACVDHYFRDEGTAAFDSDKVYGEWPLAQLVGNSWTDSLIGATAYAAANDNYDPDLVVGVDDTITGSEIEAALTAWEYARAHNLTQMSYEDYLRSNGITVAKERETKPELLRYIRNWQYPSNTVEPTTGVPSSAVSWAISERADKDRFFREPGFILGVTVTRPKVYMTEQIAAMAHFMTNPMDWLPALMNHRPETSMKQFTTSTGPLRASSENYWVDLRDLLIYGDQFVNFDSAAATPEEVINKVAIPKTDLSRRYVASTGELLNFFVDNVDAARVREDGVCNLTIATHQVDTSPRDLSPSA